MISFLADIFIVTPQLYDLMVMAVKQQILLSRDPKDLVAVTLNHLDAIHDYVRNPQARANLEMTHDLLVQGGTQFNRQERSKSLDRIDCEDFTQLRINLI